MKERASQPSFFERLEERLLSSVLGRVERLEWHMNRWADCCMRFMPRDWVEAQGFIWADAVLASVLLGLVVLSYIMFRHMLRHWSDDAHNATTPRPARRPRAPITEAQVERTGQRGCLEYGPVNEEVDGMTALMRSSSQGDEACTAELIAAGAAVDTRDSQEGFTALLMASAMGAPALPSAPCLSAPAPSPRPFHRSLSPPASSFPPIPGAPTVVEFLPESLLDVLHRRSPGCAPLGSPTAG